MQVEFGKGLLDPEMPVPDGIIGPGGRPAGRRYNVYRNNVVVSLSEALASAFPVVRSLVGEEFFNALAGVFVRQHPPTSPLMIYYGEDFPAFLESFPPAQQVAYLPDIARLEYARRESYHAADAAPCPPEKLALLESDGVENLTLHLHLSLRIIRSTYPVFSIWRFNSTEDKSPIPQQPETVLIARPADQLSMRTISESAVAFLESLATNPLGVAVVSVTETHPDFDLTANLTEILRSGLLVDIS